MFLSFLFLVLAASLHRAAQARSVAVPQLTYPIMQAAGDEPPASAGILRVATPAPVPIPASKLRPTMSLTYTAREQPYIPDGLPLPDLAGAEGPLLNPHLPTVPTNPIVYKAPTGPALAKEVQKNLSIPTILRMSKEMSMHDPYKKD